jgi:ribonucleoside-triphosphate reductase
MFHKNKITKIKKRSGLVVAFEQKKIAKAIEKAFLATNTKNGNVTWKLSDKVVAILNKHCPPPQVPTVEKIQDTVEKVLMEKGFEKAAQAYILYRDQHQKIREIEKKVDETVDMVDKYLDEVDWEVHENSNMSYSLQGLNNYISSFVTKKYWLNKIYPPEIRRAAKEGDFHIHDLNTLAAYCVGWDLYDLLIKGFGGVAGKIESKPAKHFRSALGQVVNFFYTLQGETAGAQALSSFDTLLAPFIRYDHLTYSQVKQAMQEFLFNCNVPTRVGFQTPFENLTFDVKVPSTLAKQPIVIGGKLQKETYSEFQEEVDIINRAFSEVMTEGDGKGRVFTFPIPTYNITDDFDWDSPSLNGIFEMTAKYGIWDNPSLNGIFEMTAKYGIPYFSNYISSDMDPEDARSMCCRLRLDNRQLHKRGGGLFGSYPLTGSIGVVTINMPRIGYLSKTKEEFFKRTGELMDLAKESLEIKRKVLEKFTEKGLYPYSRYYLDGIKKARGQYWANHFSTIGLIGMNEAMLNFMKKDIGQKEAIEFTSQVLDFMRDRMVDYQNKTGNFYNLEATPAEGTSYRLAKMDKEKYPDIITAGEEEVYYTNSTQLPVGYTDDLFEALRLQDDLQTRYTGGTVFHGFLGEKINDVKIVKEFIKKVFENFSLPYFTFTPTFSICPFHGYLQGEHFNCPKCLIKQPCEVYSRVVGYLRPIQQWNKGKQEEFKERKTFKI